MARFHLSLSLGRTSCLVSLCLCTAGCSFSKLNLEKQQPSETPRPYVYNVTAENLADLNGMWLSDQNVVVVGDGGEVIRSDDGGNTWLRNPQGGTDLLTVTSAPDHTVVAAGRDGSVIRSHDRGVTWERVESGVSSDLFGSFSTDRDVWLFGDKSTIIRSEDNGQRWEKVPFDSGSYLMRSLTASTDGRVLVVATNSGQLFKSGDAGKSWSKVWETGDDAINSLVWEPGGTILVAVGDHGKLLRSTDQGTTWSAVSTPFTRGLVQVTYAAAIRTFFVAGADGLLIASADDGQSWHRISLPMNRTLRTVQISSDGTLLAAGFRGTVVRGKGDAFEVMRGVPFRVDGLLATKRFGLIAFGQGGTLLRSLDSAKHWEQLSVDTDSAVTSLAESSKGLLGIGEHGTIIMSSDVTHWKNVNSGKDTRLNAVSSSPDGKYVYIAGDGGLVLSSSDFGTSWQSLVPGSTDNLNAVFVAENAVYVAGDRGVLLTAKRSGTDWKDSSVEATYSFKSIIAAPGGRHVWAFGTNGGVFYSNDGGQTWDYDDNSLTDDLSASTCLEQCKRVIAVGEHGTVVVREGSDEQWEYLTKTRFDLRSITVGNRGEIYALGSDLNVYRPREVKGIWQQNELGYAVGGFSSIDGSQLWIVGDAGQTWHSSDGGLSWEAKAIKTNVTLNSVIGDDLGVRLTAVGDKGTVATTVNQGKDWVIRKISGNSLNSVHRIGSSLWAVGYAGTILQLPPGSSDWKPTTPTSKTSLFDIAGTSDGRNLWAVGSSGLILSSTDAGQSWSQRSFGTAKLNSVLAFEGASTTVVAVGESGTILTSHDGGKDWRITGTGGGNLLSIVRSDRTRQLFAVGDGGSLLISDDEGDTWNSTKSGTTNNLTTILPILHGEKFYAFGEHGTFEKFTMFYPRYTIGSISMTHLLAAGRVQIDVSGLRKVPPPTFTVKAVRTRELDRAMPLEIPASAETADPGTSQLSIGFDLSQLNPHAGESFDLQLCLNQGTYSRCLPLPRLVAVPWIDFAKNKNWIIPILALLGVAIILEGLLFLQPLWILALYRKAVVYDVLEKTSIPGASIIKLLLQGTLLPWFAFHHRTLQAWVVAHRQAFLNRWDKDLSKSVALIGSQLYVPLPVEVRSAALSRLVTEPSLDSLAFLFAEPGLVQILGPGGIGKTTLLHQLARWRMNLGSAGSKARRAAAIAIESFTGKLDDFLAHKIENTVGEAITSEFVRHLLKAGMVVPFVDGFSELTPEFQRTLLENLGALTVKAAVLSGRTVVEVSSMEQTKLLPKPLDSRTLLHFITSLLSALPDDVHVLNTMELQLELGRKIAGVMNAAGREVPLTPLLVRLYVDSAVDLLSRGRSLDDLPESIAEAYFEFVHLLLRQESVISQASILSSLKTIARLSLGDRFVPSKFTLEAASRAIQPIAGENRIATIRSLIAAGVLTEEEVGLGTAVQFALDPLAEFCAAYAYVEEIAFDDEKWRLFFERLRKEGTTAIGFRNALALVAKECVSKGICSPEAARFASKIADSPEGKT